MGKSRRRNKRQTNGWIATMSNSLFYKILIGIFVIILICVFIMGIRFYQDKQEMAKQKETLEKQLEAIFETKVEVADNIDNKETQEQEDTVVNIAVVGDILCGNEMLTDAKTTDDYDFTSMFGEISKYVETADIAIGTMETNFTQDAYSGYGKCNSPKSFAEAVKKTGIDLVSTAHNHSLDYGQTGAKTTKKVLQELGYTVVGTKGMLEEKNYVVKEVKGIKIAFLAYTYGFSNAEDLSTQEVQYVNQFSQTQAKQDLEQASQEADYLCVMMHWGEINSTNASKEQEQIADFLVENGANMIVGAHPAVIEPMQIKQNAQGENVFISYSVGNYISSLGYENANLEMILNIQIRKQSKTGKVVLEKVTYTPIYMVDRGEKAENRFVLMDMKETARRYASGETNLITKKIYNQLITGLEKLEEIIRRKS
ncbi:MAG: CapA family protein [Clostridia bacterium]